MTSCHQIRPKTRFVSGSYNSHLRSGLVILIFYPKNRATTTSPFGHSPLCPLRRTNSPTLQPVGPNGSPSPKPSLTFKQPVGTTRPATAVYDGRSSPSTTATTTKTAYPMDVSSTLLHGWRDTPEMRRTHSGRLRCGIGLSPARCWIIALMPFTTDQMSQRIVQMQT